MASPFSARLLRVLEDLGLLLLSSLLFSLSFPSFLSQWGWFPLAFICLVPMFVVVNRAGWVASPLYGAFFGYVTYAIFDFWLAKFHPLTLLFVPPIYAAYFVLVFPALKAAVALFPIHGYVLQSLLWVSYEYFIKTSGFLAFSYGNLGYSQYLFLPLARLASITGVWGVSLLTVFPSALLARALRDGFPRFARHARHYAVDASVYAAVFLASIGYGVASRADLRDARPWKVALVQQNVDPWRGGFKAYQRSLDILIRQSDRALASHPEIVIWSETSFVPAIDWHTRYRTDLEIYQLVQRLVEYLGPQKVPFVFGNDDGRLKRLESGEEVRVDYNAAILFDRGAIQQVYRKLHLVPFTESFPFEQVFPRIYTWLKNADTHFWEKGTEPTVFEASGVRFSTPICFEDTFGYLGRLFFRSGAEVLVNLTNDSWANSVTCEMQHMSMAVFRALENQRSVVRSTNGGITCTIDPNGHIGQILTPFTEGFLLATIPVYTASVPLYSRWGDWLPWVLLAVSGAAVAAGLARAAIDKRR